MLSLLATTLACEGLRGRSPRPASVAVTVTLAVWPAARLVVSMWITPSGLVVESVVEVKRIGSTGVVPSELLATWVMSLEDVVPATNWPKIV